jgi:hypothetical protein
MTAALSRIQDVDMAKNDKLYQYMFFSRQAFCTCPGQRIPERICSIFSKKRRNKPIKKKKINNYITNQPELKMN